MELLAFAILVAVTAALGVGLGLALAPRLAAWEDRRAADAGPAPWSGRDAEVPHGGDAAPGGDVADVDAGGDGGD